MIALCSIFRNSEPYLSTYFQQIEALREHEDITLVLAEGDSVDLTWDCLLARADFMGNTHLQQVIHGGPHFGSVDNPERWEQIAKVVRPVVARAIALDPEVVVWVESDLVWNTEVMLKLIETARGGRSVAPMVFAENTDRFYDTWGFRMGGVRFYGHEPYLPQAPSADIKADHLVAIDSCGSCFATPDLHALKAWDGKWPYRAGGRLYLDRQLCVSHP